MRKRYKVLAALHGESDSGWIWIPREEGFNSRDHIIIKAIETDKKIICTCRIIDDNFCHIYKSQTNNFIEEKEKRVVVISDYYRNKLGRLETGKEYDFEIKRCEGFLCLCKKVRANLQHPDNVVKLATYLALWSIFLGLAGIVLGILSMIF